MSPYLKKLYQIFDRHRNHEDAPYMKKYMRDQFVFFGLKKPIRAQLMKDFFKENPPPLFPELEKIVLECWQLPERELQYVAVELLKKQHKLWQPEIIRLFELLITNKSWWDSVDLISGELVAPYFKKFPDQIRPITEGWMQSGNTWLQRVCLIFQLLYKAKTDTALLFDYIERLKESDEFFIQKAIGWALRHYAYTNAALVKDFVDKTPLKPLSQREALKHF
jgi:3-methyladenine DNA glycosylase AlkD